MHPHVSRVMNPIEGGPAQENVALGYFKQKNKMWLLLNRCGRNVHACQPKSWSISRQTGW